MRKISANYIFPVTQKPIKNGIIEIDDSGKILSISQAQPCEQSGVEFYNGVIVPGFVNAHCHLELSQFKGKVPQKTGLPNFIHNILKLYENLTWQAEKIQQADLEMQRNGIVAVGDISLYEISAETKRNSKIYYHTFLETMDFFDKQAGKKSIENAIKRKKLFQHSSFYAHAPYTCSVDFIKEIANFDNGIFAIHNQEDVAENELFMHGTGEFYEMIKNLSAEDKFNASGKSSLMTYFPLIENLNKNILLVHNVHTSEEEVEYVENANKNVYWVLNPLSNKYISDILPDAKKFMKHNAKICLGTDSLASNTKLDILEEMKCFNDITFENVLQWATLNGAKALNISDFAGSIEIGKCPGLNLITHFDFKNFNITKQSRVKVLV